MAYYIRKIKYEANAEALRSQIDYQELYGDVLSEYSISNEGDLSVWRIENLDDKKTLEKILIAITISTPVCEDTSFMIITDEILCKYGFSEPKQGPSGQNYCHEWELLHYNIKGIKFRDIINCLKMYRDLLQNDDVDNPHNLLYIEGSNLAEIILKAKSDDIIEAGKIKCNQCIKRDYNPLYVKYEEIIKKKKNKC